MVSGSKGPVESMTSQEPALLADQDMIIRPADLLLGDVLLYRPRTANVIQSEIIQATGSPYTHAAIYLGNDKIAESVFPCGVTQSSLNASIGNTQCVAVLRSQLGFDDKRAKTLTDFVRSVAEEGKVYDLISALSFKNESSKYFDNQLQFIQKNYGKVTSMKDFEKSRFFCSAFVVACYAVVGIIGETAQVAYKPKYFSPGHLGQDPTFGWVLGYLVPEDGAVPGDDPLLCQATLWRNCQSVRWW